MALLDFDTEGIGWLDRVGTLGRLQMILVRSVLLDAKFIIL